MSLEIRPLPSPFGAESTGVNPAILVSGAPGAILHETLALAETILGRDFAGLTVERAVVGLFFTGVKLSDGSAGTCATPLQSLPYAMCCGGTAGRLGLPARLAGTPAGELAARAIAGTGIGRAVGIAALNALAEACWRRRPYPDAVLRAGVDAFDAVEIAPSDRVVLIGAFVPFLKALKRRGQPFVVLERDAMALKPDELPFFRPAGEAAAVLPEADVVLVTGATLLDDALEDLLGLAPRRARVAIVGPTVGMLPDAFFARGAAVLGCTRIIDPDAFLDLLAEAGSPPQFLAGVAEKIALIRREV